MILELSCAKMGLWFVGSAFISFFGGIFIPDRREICADIFALSVYFIIIFIILAIILNIFNSSVSLVW
jgi:hypothetical protein